MARNIKRAHKSTLLCRVQIDKYKENNFYLVYITSKKICFQYMHSHRTARVLIFGRTYFWTILMDNNSHNKIGF